MDRLLISAAHKSSGKTTVSLGLCAALSARGVVVQPFKKGPDFIDPMWLGRASARACHNLDPYLMTSEQIGAVFARQAAGADISIVEGNKGLYDGLALDGSNSNAALAQLLDLPVLLVIDARGMTRGIAPLILGYQAFDRRIRIGGVILNRLGGSRHEAKLRAVIEHYTDVPVLGAIAEDSDLAVAERHLGLMPSNEHADAARQIGLIGERIAAQVNLDRVRALAASAPALNLSPMPMALVASPNPPVRIALAQDRAFGFYYPDDLQALRDAGAELLPFDTLSDPSLPEAIDGLFIGGGFPELFMRELQANVSLRTQIATSIADGLPTYAECGGLMYLARSLQWRGERCEMVGAVAGDATLHPKPVGRGYVHLAATEDMPWAGLRGRSVRGHEFHYSSLDGLPADTRYAWRVTRGHGIDGQHDGVVMHNLLATYSHLRSVAGTDWARHFVDFVRARRSLGARSEHLERLAA
ncbi:cobyrinate a,c-diamide synthase [Hydrogenophaga sp. D2P1]|uniref:Cobyrinate a,c-diamide synthase n=1 Tax=Hydrogenophaga aromaticivorans TaxID=2610898 RepID=A0A7Y8H0D5_9BURK|nr:cobyrinate a,c-diamide synthase [Hydrogenophaga aromaticivorans]NWF47283.1 cobyrinate a,c-diamide synthase [Hydrogenophaga aromaticivorans]